MAEKPFFSLVPLVEVLQLQKQNYVLPLLLNGYELSTY